MAQRMLIDATHPEETRVVAINGTRLEEFDNETTTKQQLKGNIYLAKVTRVEPSLQAAFVEYGGNRHGFLAFSEIHPDYYRIPIADREDLVEDEDGDDDDVDQDGEAVEELGGDEGSEEAVEETKRARPKLRRNYKIQEVIKRRQVLLVQVLKEERGNKGAALTTYLSLAGRYCVLMPNTSRGGGVSRKISNPQDRKRLKSVLGELDVPEGMAVILRTAGQERSKAEIKRDFEYIMRMWTEVRSKTLGSSAPALIHEEANLIRRSIRDVYNKDIDEVLVAGEDGYRIAKDFMKAMIPSHAKKVKRYADEQGVPLFQRYQVEQQLSQIFEPLVNLRSGGSIVLHQTEALVAIDVNSGRATRERHIEETALKTNLEAAEEISRQLRLRDLAGLIVIDFIDMDDNRNDHAVERRLKEALRNDRARIQVGRISPFGLLEMSRQRLRPSVLEAMTQPCMTCGGIGYIPSTESAALHVLRAIEEEGLRRRSREITVKVPSAVAIYILNHKRATLGEIEENYGLTVTIETDDALLPPKYAMSRIAKEAQEGSEAEPVAEVSDDGEDQNRARRKRGRRRRRRDEETDMEARSPRSEPAGSDSSSAEEVEDSADAGEQEARSDGDGDSDDGSRRRRKRGRRGGRRRRGREQTDGTDAVADSETASEDDDPDADGAQMSAGDDAVASEAADASDEKEAPRRRRRRGGRGRGSNSAANTEANTEADSDAGADARADVDAGAEDAVEATSDTQTGEEPQQGDATESEATVDGGKKAPSRRRPRGGRGRGANATAANTDEDLGSEQVEAETVSSDDAPAMATDAAAPESKVSDPSASESADDAAPEESEAPKPRARKTRATKSPGRKGAARKSAPRKTRVVKAESDAPSEASEGMPEPANNGTAPPSDAAPVAETVPAPETPAPEIAAPVEASPVAADTGAEQADAPAEDKGPKRRGWWSRVTGS